MKKLWITALVLVLALPAVLLAQDYDKKPAKKDKPAAAAADDHAFDKGAEEAKGKIDINSATKDQLMTLNGVGDATADEIVKGRPYKAKNELVKRRIVSQRVYSQIKNHIIAHQEQTATEK